MELEAIPTDPLVLDGNNRTRKFKCSLSKRLILGMGITIIGLLIALVFDKTRSGNQKVCFTPQCLEISSQILRKMNTSVDPCQDMYTYSCGGFWDKFEHPENYSWWGTSESTKDRISNILLKVLSNSSTIFMGKNSSAITKLKTFYHSCMEEYSIKELGKPLLLEWISALGSWTVTSSNITKWNRANWTIQTSLEEMHAHGFQSFFEISVELQEDNTMEYALVINPAGQIMDVESNETFIKWATDFALLLGGDPVIAAQKLSEIHKFHEKLAQIITKYADGSKKYTYLKNYPMYFRPLLNITHFLLKLANLTKIPDNVGIVLVSDRYFPALMALLNSTDDEVKANYIMWNFLMNVTDYLPNEFIKVRYQTDTVIESTRKETCVSSSMAVMEFAVSALFLENNLRYHAETKAEVSALAEEIRKEFVENLNTVDWLGEATRQRIKEKLKTVKFNIGYPEWIIDVHKLDEYYQQIKMEKNEFLNNYIFTSAHLVREQMRVLLERPAQERWVQPPIDESAFYYNSSVYLSSGYLSPPDYQPSLPLFSHYATVAFILAREMLHVLDFNGLNFQGRNSSVLTPSERDTLRERQQCFVDQYNKYTVLDVHIDGNKTLIENIADSGGLHVAYTAYKKVAKSPTDPYPGLHLGDDQLFFLGFAQSWCNTMSQEEEKDSIQTETYSPDRFRVIGSLSNMGEFAKAFNCPVNSPMNSKKKCHIW